MSNLSVIEAEAYQHEIRANMPESLQAARRIIKVAFPYFDSLNWSMVPVAVPGLGTMACDKSWRLYFDPEVVKDWDVQRCVIVVVHEMLHVFLKSCHRVHDQLASDCSVNSVLEDMIPGANQLLQQKNFSVKLEEPTDWCHPKSWSFDKGLLHEEYHDLFEAEREKHRKTCPICNGSAKAKSSKKKGQGDNSQCDKKGQNGEGQGNGEGKPDVGKADCGSVAGGGRRPWELESPENGGEDGLSQCELAVRRREIANRIEEHQKTIGNLPGGLVREAGLLLAPPKVRWQDKLRANFRYAVQWAAGSIDYSWTRANRRSSDKILYPGLVDPVPTAAVVIDTSGSMSEKDLSRALSELHGIIKECGMCRVPVLVGDASFDSIQDVSSAKQVKLVGGGGTDMRIGVFKATKLKPTPKIIIVLTDGYTPHVESPIPNTKLVEVYTQKGAEPPPAWIDCIVIDD